MAVDESTHTEQDEEQTEVDLIREAAAGHDMTRADVDAATEWFLSDEELPATRTIRINVGSADAQRWIPWTIRSVDSDVLRRIRTEGQNRAARRARQATGLSEVDPQEANARIVVEGTVAPDLGEIVLKKLRDDQRPSDPAAARMIVLKHRFRHKPGLIDQIAGEIMSLSGYDEEDIQEATAAKN